MDKDLRTILGEKVQGKYRLRYCGGGKRSLCRSELWKAIDAAGKQALRQLADKQPLLLARAGLLALERIFDVPAAKAACSPRRASSS